MKIAIFGGTGLLGSNLVKIYIDKGFNVKAFSRKHSSNIDKQYNKIINFSNLENEINKSFSLFKPDIIINTIAIVNLQKCEDDYNLAYNTNVLIAEKLASIAREYNSYFIHISTDHFFNDTKIKHTEEDETIILNNYAKTKLEAENKVLHEYNKSLIVRTNIIGFRLSGGDSFFEWLINSLKNKDKISLFTNFYTSPIGIYKLSKMLLECFKHKISGIYNIASSETIDKYSFGIKVANKFGYSIDNINKSIIKTDISTEIDRALTLGLEVSKIEDILSIKMPTINETINDLYVEYMENK